jgi:prepilin-type N-terminal cleavage/methylation domain-containing protein
MRRRQGGFTMTELMATVAILSVAAGAAITGMRPDRVASSARTVSSLITEARQLALAGGPIRGDVATATGVTARTQVEVDASSDDTIVRLWRAVEDDDSATLEWELVSHAWLPSEVVVYAVGTTAASLAGGTLPAALGDGTAMRSFFPDGTAEAATVYLGRKGDTEGKRSRYRVIVFPIIGTPQIYVAW